MLDNLQHHLICHDHRSILLSLKGFCRARWGRVICAVDKMELTKNTWHHPFFIFYFYSFLVQGDFSSQSSLLRVPRIPLFLLNIYSRVSSCSYLHCKFISPQFPQNGPSKASNTTSTGPLLLPDACAAQ